MEPLLDLIIVTCHCGAEMIPLIAGPDEVLYGCSRDDCPHQTQVNVMTKARAAAIDAAAAQEADECA